MPLYIIRSIYKDKSPKPEAREEASLWMFRAHPQRPRGYPTAAAATPPGRHVDSDVVDRPYQIQ